MNRLPIVLVPAIALSIVCWVVMRRVTERQRARGVRPAQPRAARVVMIACWAAVMAMMLSMAFIA